MTDRFGGSWEVLVSKSRGILSGSRRSLSDDLVRFSWTRSRGMKILVKVFLQLLMRRSCGDHSEMLSGALRDLV